MRRILDQSIIIMSPNIILAAMSALPPRRQHKRWAQGIE